MNAERPHLVVDMGGEFRQIVVNIVGAFLPTFALVYAGDRLSESHQARVVGFVVLVAAAFWCHHRKRRMHRSLALA